MKTLFLVLRQCVAYRKKCGYTWSHCFRKALRDKEDGLFNYYHNSIEHPSFVHAWIWLHERETNH